MSNILEVKEYQIFLDKPIGKGAQGQIFHCQRKHQPNFQGPALCAKIQAINQKTRRSSEREMSVINQLKDSHNINILFIEKAMSSATQFIQIMEYCPNELQNEIVKYQTFKEEDIIDFFIQIINGYKAFYDNKIVHRDIKPQNILITQDLSQKKIFKIGDFGTCDFVDLNNIQLTKTGSAAYTAPELYGDINQNDMNQLENDMKKCKLPSQSDIFSIGIILYQLYFGKHPCDQLYHQEGIRNFHQQLKNKNFIIDSSAQKYSEILNILSKMILYWPSERITFQQCLDKCQIFRTPKFPLPQQNPINKTSPQQQVTQKNFMNNQTQPSLSFQFQQPQPNRFINNAQIPPQNNFFINQKTNHDRAKSPFQKQAIQQQQVKFNLQPNMAPKNQLGNQIPNYQQLQQKQGHYSNSPERKSTINKLQPQIQDQYEKAIPSKGSNQINKYDSITKYLQHITLEMFQLFYNNKQTFQEIQEELEFFSNQNNELHMVQKHVFKLKQLFPFTQLSNNELYISFQYSLYSLMNPAAPYHKFMTIQEKINILSQGLK